MSNNNIKDYLQKYFNDVSEETVEVFSSIITSKKFHKGNTIIEQNKPTDKFYVLKSGLVGSFVKNEDNNGFIRTLYTKGNAFGALSSLIKDSIANASYECLTNCDVLEADFKDFIKLKETNRDFDILYNKVLEETYLRSEKKMDDLCLLDAKDRYLKLIREIPKITNFLPQYQIANYLSITPVQLSRIRKKLTKEELE